MRGLLLFMGLFLFCSEIGIGQDDFSNSLALEIGYGGGDGIFPTYLYGIQYGRKISNRVEVVAKYNTSMGTESSLKNLDRQFVKTNNTAEEINTRYSQFSALGIGLKTNLIVASNSDLYVLTGFGIISQNISRIDIIGKANEPVSVHEIYVGHAYSIGYEIGLGYKKTFSKNYFVAGSVNHISAGGRISASLIIGVHF